MSSVTSDGTPSAIFSSYATPQRNYFPPSDIESEYEAEGPSELNASLTSQSSPPLTTESKKLHKLLDVYKVKYSQLKNAYDEVEGEKEKIKVDIFMLCNASNIKYKPLSFVFKKILSESQDKVLKRVQDLKEQIENDKKAHREAEAQLKNQITEKETLIIDLRNQVSPFVVIE
jgi:hypothetical protein